MHYVVGKYITSIYIFLYIEVYILLNWLVTAGVYFVSDVTNETLNVRFCQWDDVFNTHLVCCLAKKVLPRQLCSFLFFLLSTLSPMCQNKVLLLSVYRIGWVSELWLLGLVSAAARVAMMAQLQNPRENIIAAPPVTSMVAIKFGNFGHYWWLKLVAGAKGREAEVVFTPLGPGVRQIQLFQQPHKTGSCQKWLPDLQETLQSWPDPGGQMSCTPLH